MKNRSLIFTLTAVLLSVFMASCSNGSFSLFKKKKDKINTVGKRSGKTNIKYGDSKKGGSSFAPKKFKEAPPGPGLILIPGGTFMMGGGEKDIEYNMDNRTRQVTVQSFYMDEVEVANVDWKEFMFSKGQDPNASSGEAATQAAPTGGSEGSSGDIESQAKVLDLMPDTSVWLRDLAFNDPIAESYFDHPAFNMYPVVGISWHQANEYCKWRTEAVNNTITEKDEDAVAYPSYRLPTEAEWEYAARGLQESEIYAWEGKSLRNRKGKFRANFKRGRGDYAGWRGGGGRNMTDGYMITAPVKEFWPNDFGLYNMSGNVAEWTQDNYRVLSFEDVDDFNPYRRRGKTEIRPDQWLDDDTYEQKESLLFNVDPFAPEDNSQYDNVKVVRGGSWQDIAYYLSPGVRRFFPADSSSATIGFRCAMIKVGSPD